jgi:putative acetyltransferase
MSGAEDIRSALVIRPLEADDCAELARLTQMPGFRYGTLRPPYPTIASVRKRFDQLGPEDLFLGAFLDERLVGNAGLHRMAGRRRHVAAIGMGVADDMNGKGIGTALLEALIEAADKWLDIHRLELTVFADNERAIALYERYGFEREGLLRDYAYRDGRYADVITMARLRKPAGA